MTEDEAKTKWCSDISLAVNLATVSAAIRGHVNEMQRLSSEDQNCIASGCSKWEWNEALDTDNDGNPTGGTNYDTEGHCGLTR